VTNITIKIDPEQTGMVMLGRIRGFLLCRSNFKRSNLKYFKNNIATYTQVGPILSALV
jgi:hypothetical protein